MDISVTKNKGFICLLYAAFFAVVVYFSFFYQWEITSADELRREINGPFRKWINGYLSLLTNTKYSGPFCLLTIPAWIYLYREKRYEAFAFFLFSVFLIGAKGYINYRYAYTLFPLMLFVFGFVFVEKNWLLIKNIYFITILAVFIHTLFFTVFELYPKYANRLQIGHKSVSKNVFDYINDSEQLRCGTFLVNNLPEFYYRCKNKGYYFWCKEDELFTEQGKRTLFGSNSSHLMLHHMGVEYILSDTIFGKDNPRFSQFIQSQTIPVFSDAKGRVIYKIIR